MDKNNRPYGGTNIHHMVLVSNQNKKFMNSIGLLPIFLNVIYFLK